MLRRSALRSHTVLKRGISNRLSERWKLITRVAASLAESFHQPEYRITHRQQQQRVNAVLRIGANSRDEKRRRAKQRQRRRDRVSPRAVRPRLFRFTPPQNEKRNKREDVVDDEEERQHRNYGLELLAEDDEHQRHDGAQEQRHRRRAAFVHHRRPLRKQPITA